MKVTWIGHACFKIEKDGYTVIFDPYNEGSVPGLKDVREKADLVLCSHEHGDHNGRACVELIEGKDNPFTVTVIDTYHDDAKGSLRGSNKIHILDDGQNRIAHMGDLGCELEPEQLEVLKGLDVMLIPIGGFFTIDAQQAGKLMEQIKPKVTIPMHYRKDPEGGIQFGYPVIDTIDTFIKEQENVSIMDESSFEIADDSSGVIVLQPQNA